MGSLDRGPKEWPVIEVEGVQNVTQREFSEASQEQKRQISDRNVLKIYPQRRKSSIG